MKKSIFLTLCIFPFIPVNGAQWDNNQDRSLPQSSRRVVMMGNSITENWLIHTINNHKEFFENNGVLCRGIAAQKTSQFLNRFDDDVVSIKPLVVVIAGGVNDVNGGINEDEVYANLTQMAIMAASAGIKPIIASINPSGWDKSTVDKYININRKIAKFCIERGYRYCNYFDVLKDDDFNYNEMKEEYRGGSNHTDHLHPSREGYLKMEEVLIPLIEESIWYDNSYEAENAIKIGNSLNDELSNDASGGVYVDGIGKGGCLNFGYNCLKDDKFFFMIRYSSLSGATIRLTVNGNIISEYLPNTGGVFLEHNIAIELYSGFNNILINIDEGKEIKIDLFSIKEKTSATSINNKRESNNFSENNNTLHERKYDLRGIQIDRKMSGLVGPIIQGNKKTMRR